RGRFKDWYTLWPLWVDTHVDSPFQTGFGTVRDSIFAKVPIYHNTEKFLSSLHSQGFMHCIAVSLTSETEGANQLLSLYKLDQYISFKEIYPGSKVTHFKRNIVEVCRLGKFLLTLLSKPL
uniref:Uncharacterized protein n=1 Tax=Sinocyclocheilus grahami TaxID=75366 RepID=A0A672NU43_SINGR